MLPCVGFFAELDATLHPYIRRITTITVKLLEHRTICGLSLQLSHDQNLESRRPSARTLKTIKQQKPRKPRYLRTYSKNTINRRNNDISKQFCKTSTRHEYFKNLRLLQTYAKLLQQ